MNIGDHVRAQSPYAGVPSGEGVIIKVFAHSSHPTQFLVRFAIQAKRSKDFYLSERELVLVPPPPPGPPPRE